MLVKYDAPALIDDMVKFLKGYTKQSNTQGYVIGISGGIDSTVTATLCARTGYPVQLYSLPIDNSHEDMERAHEVGETLVNNYENVSYASFPLGNIFHEFTNVVDFLDENYDDEKTKFANANFKSRLRMCHLYYIANLYNMLVVGTGNFIEDSVAGFFTKWGDGAVDINPLGTFLKSEVYELGEELGVNKSVLEAKPTDGLWLDNRDDESQLGLTYDEIEEIVEEGYEADIEKEKIDRLFDLYNKNKHKMESIPVFPRKPEYIMGDDPLENFK